MGLSITLLEWYLVILPPLPCRSTTIFPFVISSKYVSYSLVVFLSEILDEWHLKFLFSLAPHVFFVNMNNLYRKSTNCLWVILLRTKLAEEYYTGIDHATNNETHY